MTVEQFPLAPAQRRMWTVEQLRPGTCEFVVTAAFQLQGHLDRPRLDRALRALLNRHGMLRTRITRTPKGPIQELLPSAQIQVQQYDSAQAMLGRIAGSPFDLQSVPLLRVALAPAEGGVVLGLALHHLVCDAVACDLIARDLATLYRCDGDESAAGLPDLALEFADYARWLADRTDRATIEEDLDYWSGQLADADLRPLFGPIGDGSARTVERTVPLDPELTAVARATGASDVIVAIAATQVAIARVMLRTDFCVGTTVSTRQRPELRDVVGCFVELLPLRTDLQRSITPRQLLGATRDRLRSGVRHAAASYDDTVARIRRDHRRVPGGTILDGLLEVVVTQDGNGSVCPFDLDGMRATPVSVPTESAQYPLVLDLRTDPGGIRLRAVAAVAALSADQVARIVEEFTDALRAFGASPDAPLPRMSFDAPATVPGPAALTDGVSENHDGPPCGTDPTVPPALTSAVQTGPARAEPAGFLDLVRSSFSAALAADLVGPDTDFFDAGGTSYSAVRLAESLSTQISHQVPVRAVFDHPTPRQLADEIARRTASRASGQAWNPNRDELLAALVADSRACGSVPRALPHQLLRMHRIGPHELAAACPEFEPIEYSQWRVRAARSTGGRHDWPRTTGLPAAAEVGRHFGDRPVAEFSSSAEGGS